jgi:hypothetical protein
MRLKIMDRTGHSVVDLEDNQNGLARAEKKFKELTGQGFIAAVPAGNGEHRVIKEFDKEAQEVLFMPHLVGG